VVINNNHHNNIHINIIVFVEDTSLYAHENI
jgi:hypothetical protein